MATYTALFDQLPDAESAQRELAKLGVVPVDHIRVSGKDAESFNSEKDADNRTFWESLKGFFVSHEDRPVYEDGVRAGGFLLTVNVDDQSSQQVHELLERSNAVNVDEREARYRASAAALNTKVPILEEQLNVGKRRVEQGGVRVRSYVVTTPVEQDVTLREDRVVIERHAVDQAVDHAQLADVLRERSVELKTSKEEAVVAKEARVVEEVSIRKDVGERVEHVVDTVRHTEVDVEPVGSGHSKSKT